MHPSFLSEAYAEILQQQWARDCWLLLYLWLTRVIPSASCWDTGYHGGQWVLGHMGCSPEIQEEILFQVWENSGFWWTIHLFHARWIHRIWLLVSLKTKLYYFQLQNLRQGFWHPLPHWAPFVLLPDVFTYFISTILYTFKSFPKFLLKRKSEINAHMKDGVVSFFKRYKVNFQYKHHMSAGILETTVLFPYKNSLVQPSHNECLKSIKCHFIHSLFQVLKDLFTLYY